MLANRINPSGKGISLNNEQERAIVERILDDFNRDIADREEWMQNRERLYKKYRGVTDPKDFPWPGCSNLHLPVTMTAVETIHPRLVNTIFAVRPYAAVRPQEARDVERARRVEQFLDYALEQEMDVFLSVDDWIHNMLIDGVSVMKVSWRQERRKVIDVEHELDFDLMLGVDNVEYVPTLEEVEVERDEVIYDAPWVENIDLEDLVLPAMASDLQEADHVIHRLWLSMDHLRRRAADGIYRNVEKLEEESEEANGRTESFDRLKTLKKELEGTGSSIYSRQPGRREVLEAYYRYDVDGDGYEEECIFTVDRRAEVLLRADLLDTVFAHSLRPFVAMKLMPVPGRFYAIGVPELIEHLQDELNAIHNQRVDFGTLTNTPFGWYRAASGFKPEVHTIEPGKLFPVDSVGDVQLATLPSSTAWGEREEMALLGYLERLLGISDFNVGRQIDRMNAPKTATATLALIQEGNVRLDLIVKRVQHAFKAFLSQILQLYQQYIPPGKVIRIFGPDGHDTFLPVTREDIRGRFDFTLLGTSASANKLLERDTSVELYLALRDDPLLDPAVNPEGAFELRRRVLRSYDLADLELILPRSVLDRMRVDRAAQELADLLG